MKKLENAKKLIKNLKQIKKVVSNKTTMKALTCVKFDGDGKNLTITGINPELNTYIVKSMESGFKGQFCVPLKSLLAALQGMKFTKFEVNESKLKVFINDSAFIKINTFPVDEYPSIPEYKKVKNCFKIQNKVINPVLKNSLKFAYDDDEIKPYLYGFNFKYNENLRIESCDGHRLLVTDKIEIESKNKKEDKFLLRKNAAAALIEMTKQDGSLDIKQDESFIIFNINDGYLSVKKSDEDFPPVDAVIPKNPEIKCSMNRIKLLETMKNTQLIRKQNKSDKAVELDINENNVNVSLLIDDIDFNDQIECNCNSKIQIAFNPDYMVDALNVLQDDKVELLITDTLTGIRINEKNVEMVIMPIRL